jgi:hypothetical protein
MSGSPARQIRTWAWFVRNDHEIHCLVTPTESALLMPHSKCVACKTRLESSGAPADLVGELCPSCGGLLEPVGSLVEVVGFRRITRRPDVLEVDIAQAAALPRPLNPR